MRDRLPVTSAAKLAAQLLMLVRGFFYDGWWPATVPKRIRSLDEFLADLRQAFSEEPDFDAEAALREVISVVRLHILEGEMEDVRPAPPHARTTMEDTRCKDRSRSSGTRWSRCPMSRSA